MLLYFIYEFYVNQKFRQDTQNNVIENFETNMNANSLEDERNVNLGIFNSFNAFFNKRKEFFRNDIDIANYFIKKNLLLTRYSKNSKDCKRR